MTDIATPVLPAPVGAHTSRFCAVRNADGNTWGFRVSMKLGFNIYETSRFWTTEGKTYRATSLIRIVFLREPYGRPMPRALRWSCGGHTSRFCAVRNADGNT